MQSIIFLTCLFIGLAVGAPQFGGRQQNRPNVYRDPQPQQTYQGQRSQPIQILRYENENNGDGTYRYNYETENGISAYESGFVQNRGTDSEANQVEGAYQYYDPEGQLIKVTYTAGVDGFQPKGDHLPTPPPIPEAIQKALAIIYANAEKQLAAAARNPNNNRYN